MASHSSAEFGGSRSVSPPDKHTKSRAPDFVEFSVSPPDKQAKSRIPDNSPNSYNRNNNINRLASSPTANAPTKTNVNLLGPSSYGSIEYSGTPMEIPKEKKAEIVKKHLVIDDRAEGHGSPSESIYSTSHQLPGSEAAHDVYKWHQEVENEPMKRTRSRSLFIPRSEPSDPLISNIREPGGFRRHYVRMKARQEGKMPPNFITKNFIDFLAMYGNFAGEDLSDDEDEDEIGSIGSYEEIPEDALSHGGTASPSKAVFLLLKSFIGTGVMFLPKAFFDGGMIFSLIFLVAIAAVSLQAFLLLVETRAHIEASFGEIGYILYGERMRRAVLFSITISQIGFVCAYMIFVAENLSAFVENALGLDLTLKVFLVFQAICFIPLSMIRKISRLSLTAVVADAFILFGLLYLYYYDFERLITHGVAKDIKFLNLKDFALFIGTAVFAFEGIGLLIPITETMREPEKFPKVLTGVMIFITILFTSIGALSYAAFGKHVNSNVILSLPSDSPVVQAVQFLYAIAILLSIPLQLFPAVRIMEQGLFTRSGKDNPLVKWQKNMFRAFTVIICALISFAGSDDLGKFVSLIGSFACVPLCFIYPPLFHLRVAATTRAKILDSLVLVFGVVAMFYTTFITIILWGEED